MSAQKIPGAYIGEVKRRIERNESTRAQLKLEMGWPIFPESWIDIEVAEYIIPEGGNSREGGAYGDLPSGGE